MDQIPDEILIKIFAHLNAWTLLHDVALVCKRWLRVSRDPMSWAEVRLSVWVSKGKMSVSDARLLRHAPRLKALRLIALSPQSPGAGKQAEFATVVAQCTPNIGELSLRFESTDDEFLQAVRLLVERSGARVRAADMYLPSYMSKTLKELVVNLPCLQQLEELKVFDIDCSEEKGSLRGVFTCLQRLDLTASNLGTYVELLDTAAETLRDLVLRDVLHLDETAVSILARCRHLVSLEVDVSGLPAVAAMPSLEALSVFVPDGPIPAAQLSLAAATLLSLTSLHLCLVRVEQGFPRDVLAALGPAAPRLLALKLCCSDVASEAAGTAVADFLQQQPSLRAVRLDTCSDRELEAVAALPQVERVDLALKVGDFEAACATVKGMKARLTSLKGRVVVECKSSPRRRSYRWS